MKALWEEKRDRLTTEGTESTEEAEGNHGRHGTHGKGEGLEIRLMEMHELFGSTVHSRVRPGRE